MAHPGGLDRNGGHNDHVTGRGYHYHDQGPTFRNANATWNPIGNHYAREAAAFSAFQAYRAIGAATSASARAKRPADRRMRILKDRAGVYDEQVFVPMASRSAAGLKSNDTFEATVESVITGDTLNVRLANGRKITVGLAAVDAPEMNQPWGMQSRQFARQFIGEQCLGIVLKVDEAVRVVSKLSIPRYKTTLNRMVIEEGQGWYLEDHLKSKTLKRAQAEAEKLNRGIWAGSPPIPPWKWRDGIRSLGQLEDNENDREEPFEEWWKPGFVETNE